MDAQHPHSQLPPWSQVLRTGSNQTVVHHEPMDAGHPHSQLDPGHVFNEGCGTNGTPGQSVQNPSSAEATGAVELRRIRRVQTCIAIAILLKHFYRCTFLDTVMINKHTNLHVVLETESPTSRQPERLDARIPGSRSALKFTTCQLHMLQCTNAKPGQSVQNPRARPKPHEPVELRF